MPYGQNFNAYLGRSDWPKLMEQTAGKPDPQVPSLVTEQLERPEQLKQLSPSTKGQSEEETYEESIQEEKEIVDDAGDAGDAGDVDDTPAQPEQPSSPPSELLSDTWDHMRGGPQYEAFSFLEADNQGISTSRSPIHASPGVRNLQLS